MCILSNAIDNYYAVHLKLSIKKAGRVWIVHKVTLRVVADSRPSAKNQL